MIIATADNSYLLFFKNRPKLKAFLRYTRVRANTYAEEMMQELYDDIFSYSVELRYKYCTYYSIEYPRFSQFVDSFSPVSDSILSKIDGYFGRFDLIIHYRGTPEYLRGEDGIQLLSKLFQLKILQ